MHRFAETLANDIISYVTLNYGRQAYRAMAAKSGILTDCIVKALELDPPGANMDLEYRQDFVKAFAETFHHTL